MSTVTEILQREMEYMNRFKSIAKAYEPINCASMLAASSSVQNITGAMDSLKYIQDSITARASLGVTDYAFGGSLTAFPIGSAVQKSLESINLQNIVKDSLALHKINQPDFFSDFQKRVGSSISSSFQTVMDNIKESISVTAAEALRRFDEVQKSIIPLNIAQQTTSSLLGLNSIQEAIGFRTSAIQKTMQTMQHMKIFADTKAITKVISQMQFSGVLEKSLSALNTERLFAQAIDSFNSASYLSDFEANISDFELSESISLIENAGETNFLDVFTKINPIVKWIILFLLLQILVPQINDIISAKLAMPYIDRMLKSGKMNTEQVRSVQNVPLPDIDTSNLRFITRTGEKLRAKPNNRSEVLDELAIGQVFQVIQKKKSWAEIAYSCEGERMCRGWILTTYTARFKNKAKRNQ